MCGQRWDRGHTRCMEVLPCSVGVLTLDEELLMDIDKVLLPPDTKYTIVDYLLNIRAYDRAYLLLTQWYQLMGQEFHAAQVLLKGVY